MRDMMSVARGGGQKTIQTDEVGQGEGGKKGVYWSDVFDGWTTMIQNNTEILKQ